VRTADVEIRAPSDQRFPEVLTPDALGFLARLHREVEPERDFLLENRAQTAERLRNGGTFDFLEDMSDIRENAEWRVADVPHDLRVRKVEITGPTDRKMVINALNSGASVFMADFEDANTPTWRNMVEGQQNLIDAIERKISLTNPDGKKYQLNEQTATLVVRPRGWHLPERHLQIDGIPISGAIFDFGLYVFHNAVRLIKRGTGPYFYLPKLESHREARLWNEIFDWTEKELNLGHGRIKATVLVEVLPMAFEMEETLYELRTHSAGLNAGRWDYMFSIIKKLGDRKEFVLPDRAQVTMTVPFMRAYTELLVKTCHKRGAFALGGMAAFIPNRRDAAVTETALGKVREDKMREANDGFDGTWVAHPDLVETAMKEFDRVLGKKPNQLGRQRPEVNVTANQLLDVRIEGGTVTEAGLRTNVSVGIQYLASWLRGTGAAAINNLMEDAATAEISRSQIWQWIHHGVSLAEGPRVTAQLVRDVEREELAKIEKAVGADFFAKGRYEDARQIFEQVALSDEFHEFLTIAAYEHID
jgi:malate synthase